MRIDIGDEGLDSLATEAGKAAKETKRFFSDAGAFLEAWSDVLSRDYDELLPTIKELFKWLKRAAIAFTCVCCVAVVCIPLAVLL